jgi:hypothetical protein
MEKDVAPYPEPPKFWKLYSEDWRTIESLQAPPEPKDGKWKFLGTQQILGDTRHHKDAKMVVGDWQYKLQEMGVDLLVSSDVLGGPNDGLNVEKRREALQQLNHALVFNFLELLDIINRDPGPVRISFKLFRSEYFSVLEGLILKRLNIRGHTNI